MEGPGSDIMSSLFQRMGIQPEQNFANGYNVHATPVQTRMDEDGPLGKTIRKEIREGQKNNINKIMNADEDDMSVGSVLSNTSEIRAVSIGRNRSKDGKKKKVVVSL